MKLYKNQGLPNCTKGAFWGHSFTAHPDIEKNMDEFFNDSMDESFAIRSYNGDSETSIQNIRYTHCIICGYQVQDIVYMEDGKT